MNKKETLQQANKAIIKGDHEGFLALCTDDTEWTFVGDRTLRGKQAVREWMKEAYTTPPRFNVARLIEEDEFVVALGNIAVTNEDGREEWHKYCDVWRFRDGKMSELKAFVIRPSDSE